MIRVFHWSGTTVNSARKLPAARIHTRQCPERRPASIRITEDCESPSMFGIPPTHLLLIAIVLLSILLMLLRPRGIAEVWWIGSGAALLVVLRLIPLRLAGHAVAEGTDVYLFLTGMMLLSELARYYGVFDWVASVAVEHARGSCARLFTLVYAVGVGRHRLHVQRCHGGCAHSGGAERRAAVEGRAAAPSVCLRHDCQRGLVRAAHLQPGQPGGLPEPHAAVRALDRGLRCCRRCCRSRPPTWCCAGLSAATCAAPFPIISQHPELHAGRQVCAGRHLRHRRRVIGCLRARPGPWIAHMHLRAGRSCSRAGRGEDQSDAHRARYCVERAAAGCRAVCAGGSDGAGRRDAACLAPAGPRGGVARRSWSISCRCRCWLGQQPGEQPSRWG